MIIKSIVLVATVFAVLLIAFILAANSEEY